MMVSCQSGVHYMEKFNKWWFGCTKWQKFYVVPNIIVITLWTVLAMFGIWEPLVFFFAMLVALVAFDVANAWLKNEILGEINDEQDLK